MEIYSSGAETDDSDLQSDNYERIIQADIFSRILRHDDNIIPFLRQHADAIQPLIPIECLDCCPCMVLINKGFEGWGPYDPRAPVNPNIVEQEKSQIECWLQAGACSCLQGQQDLDSEEVFMAMLSLGCLVATVGPVELMECLAELCPACIDTRVPGNDLTPLYAAVAARDQYEIVEFLANKLSADDVNVKSMSMRNSPLMEAVRTQNHSVVECLLSVPGIEMNTRNTLQETPLIHAVRKDDRDNIHSLINAGADVNMKDKHGRNALSFAVRTGTYHVIQDLLTAGIEIDVVDEQGETIVLLAVFREDVHILKMLLDAGANPNCVSHDGFPALVAAAYDTQSTMLECLLNGGANKEQTNNQGYSALHISAWNGHTRNVEILLEHEALHDERTTDGNTPLSLACHGRCSSVVELLLSMPCNVNNADKDGDTPLHYCAWNGDEISMTMLLQEGANPHVVNRLGTSPLWNTVQNNCMTVAKLLIQRNADLTVKSVGIDQHAQTTVVVECYDRPRSLMWIAAVKNSNSEMVAMLIAAGYPVWKETWLQDDVESQALQSVDLRCLLKLYANTPPRLLVACRTVVRNIMGPTIHAKVETLDIPNILKQYILLTDVVGTPSFSDVRAASPS